jgi:TolB protein
MRFVIKFVIITLFTASCVTKKVQPKIEPSPTSELTTENPLVFEQEKHFKNVRQLTFGGNNAEAYWRFDNKKLVFQSDWKAINDQGCDQIFTIDVASSDPVATIQKVSTGKGRTTCAYYLPDNQIIYASTHAGGEACPTFVPANQGKYVWPIFNSYNIYITDEKGSYHKPLIESEAYDAEATVSPDGKYIVFTSTRSGDLDLWRYEIATGDLLQLTNMPGYDGGAFFSNDSKMLVWRASRPTGDELVSYESLLKQGMVEPSDLNIFVSDIDGKNVRQVTNLKGANWAPFFHPDGKRVLFTSNHHTMQQGGREFDVFMINTDGSQMERITWSGTFDAFPMFSFDGKYLVFASNRNAERKPTRDTNVFVAEWVD